MEIKNKKLIRRMMIDLRSQMTADEVKEKSKIICDKLIKSEGYQKAETLLIYHDYANEVKTDFIMQDALEKGKKVFCPKVIRDEMEFYQIMGADELKEGYKGILEPDGKSLAFTEVYGKSAEGHFVVMPGVAFDKNRNRIGYGRGFYDKFLAKHDLPWKAAICYDYQVVDEIETDKYDRKADVLYTEMHEF